MNAHGTTPMDTTPFRARRARLLARMQAAGGGVAILPTAPERVRNRDAHYAYRHDSYFYYLTAFREPEAVRYAFTNFPAANLYNGAGLPAWPRYAVASDQLIDFTNAGPVAKVSPHKARWDAIAARY